MTNVPGGGDNVADLVRAAARRTPDKVALVAGDQERTWGELDREVDAAAAALVAAGAGRGDRVALQLGNTLAFPVCYFGCLRAGLVAVPVNPAATAPELDHLLRDSGARLLLASGVTAAAAVPVAAAQPDPPPVLVAAGRPPAGTRALAELMPADPQPVAPTTGGEDLAVLLYTSGTSGRPRGALLPHRALLANLEQCARVTPPITVADDVVLLVLPLFHVYGLNAALGSVAWHGATGVLVERFDPVATLEEIRRRGVTCVVGAPPMYLAWSLLPDVAAGFAQVRIALSGAAPLPPEVLARMRERTGRPVYEGYGLTETAPVLTSTCVRGTAKPGSVGGPVPGVELELRDEQGCPVEDGDPGEITVRGPNLFTGFWPDGADGPDPDGWFATGDIAYADGDGDLHLVDRRRELILVSGFNVYPREVELVLASLPGVAEAAVLGVPHPYTGETVQALVVPEPGAQLTAEQVIAHCAASLARFKCPTVVTFVPELPHSATGKVSKGRLRAQRDA